MVEGEYGLMIYHCTISPMTFRFGKGFKKVFLVEPLINQDYAGVAQAECMASGHEV